MDKASRKERWLKLWQEERRLALGISSAHRWTNPPDHKLMIRHMHTQVSSIQNKVEYQIFSPQVCILEGSHSESLEELVSPSYPGLLTHYVKHAVTATVSGLPKTSFDTVERRDDGELRAHWEWRDR